MSPHADLCQFELGDMVRLVAQLRELALVSASVEEFARLVTRTLYDGFRAPAGTRQTALVRVYGTAQLGDLPEAERAFVDPALRPETTCLTLLGTAGDLPAWNDRTASVGHRVLPLIDPEQVAQMPMIAGLLTDMGIDVGALTAAEDEVLLKTSDGSGRIFYVADAVGSPLIPAQDFVAEHAIVSAIGFGGALPTGEVLAVVLFAKAPVPFRSAELFDTVALSVSLASLNMLDLPLLDGLPRRSRPAAARFEGERLLRARADLSQALVTAHEAASMNEADKAVAALAQARVEAGRATALAGVALRIGSVGSLEGVRDVLLEQGLPAMGGDGLAFALIDPTGTRIHIAMSDLFTPAVVARFAESSLDEPRPTMLCARTGEPVVIEDSELGDDRFPGVENGFREVGVRSVMAMPLLVNGESIGALSCTWTLPRSFAPADLEFLRALAAQAAQAIDRTRLLDAERKHSAALQRSLLTQPPRAADLQIAVRYQAAAEIAQVGGDWYDAFGQPGGAMVFSIGDVVGHDTAAAAAMGQVRTLLRGIAWHTGGGPAEALRGVDEAMEGLLVDTTASALVARLEQTPDERAQGITRLRWSNAGHPPPMVLLPDGQVQVLGHDEADLILGVDPQTARREFDLEVPRGATVLFYTDGLVERRGENLDAGLQRLAHALAEHRSLDLERLCDRLLEQLAADADDDVVLLAVHLREQA